MKILHIIARVNLGGTARWLDTLTTEQLRSGHQVLIAAGNIQHHESEYPKFESSPVVHISRLGRRVSILNDIQSISDLRSLVGDVRPDIVNTHTAKAGVVGRAAVRSLGRRRPALVHTVHGHLFSGYFRTPTVKAIASIERLLAATSDVVLAAGSKVRTDLIRANVAQPNKIIAVRPGVRDLVLQPRSQAQRALGLATSGEAPTDEVVVGWLARVVKVKRPDRMVEVARLLPNTRFLVGGSGERIDELQATAPPNTHLTGWTSPEQFWSACDAAILTSDNEALPYSLIEAALAGLPAVTTDAGSAAEVVINGRTGFVVPGNAHSVAQGLHQLLADRARMEQMGTLARAHALEHFSPTQMLEAHTEAYQIALLRRGRTP